MDNPQTATQINTPQAGAVDIKPTPQRLNLPVNPKPRPTPKAVTPKPNKIPDGWYSLSLTGLREGVSKAISAASDVPEWRKSALLSELASFDARFNFIKLDLHYTTDASGRHTLHSTFTTSTVLAG